MIPTDAEFVVRAFGRGGVEVGATWHRTVASADVEVSVWKTRFDQGECLRVEVVDLRRARIDSFPPWPLSWRLHREAFE